MKIGINGNRLVASGDVSAITNHAADVAAAGIGSYWLAQHPAGAMDALGTLIAVGGRQRQLALGTGVIPIWGRHPAALAAQVLTASQSIPGGLTVGIGLSHVAMVGQHLGALYTRPLATMREYLEVLVPLVRDGQVDHEGRIFQCHTKVVVAGPPTDVLVAAMGPRMLELAGALADGTIVTWTGPRTIRDHVIPTISKAAADHGRPPPRIAAVFSACVTDDADTARAAVHEWFEFHGRAPSYDAMLEREGVASASDVALIGDETEVAGRILDLAALGVTDLIIGEAVPGDVRTRRLLAEVMTTTDVSP